MSIFEIYKDYPEIDFIEESKTQGYRLGSRMEQERIIQLLQGWGYISPDRLERDARLVDAIREKEK
jgi:hypothetical protein